MLSIAYRTHLQQGLFSGSRCVPRDKGHQSSTPLGFLFDDDAKLCFGGIAGVLLAVPVEEKVVAGVEQWQKQVPQGLIGFRGRHTALHDFQITRNLPVLDVGHAAVVRNVLWVKAFEERRKQMFLQILGIKGLVHDQMTPLGELAPDDLLADFLADIGSHKRK